MIRCCENMEQHSRFKNCESCRNNDLPWCVDQIVIMDGNKVGIPIHDGGGSYIEIKHCPWCGTKLSKMPVGVRL
jgi:hypothetical protein